MPRSPANDPEPSPAFADATSIRLQAAGHKICTARLPLNALSVEWSSYPFPNRPLRQAHVSKLCAVFKLDGLQRQADTNFLLVKAPRRMINGITEHNRSLGIAPRVEATNDTTTEVIHDLRDWERHYAGYKLEVLAGQHRMAALRQYVRETGAGEAELWWNCVVYDQDTLTYELDALLRVNRKEATLPDSHAQLWRQLTAAHQHNPDMFDESKTTKTVTERYMLQQLQLGRESSGILWRLLTLWRRKAWRETLTEWNGTAVGYATFNINTFLWMSSLRLDEVRLERARRKEEQRATSSGSSANKDRRQVMLRPITASLRTIRQCPPELLRHIRLSDWQWLARCGGRGCWRELFYPGAQGVTPGKRHRALLSHVNDSVYKDVLRHIEDADENGGVEFPDLVRFLNMPKAEGEALASVMRHVIEWLYPEQKDPTGVVDRSKSNKPELRKDAAAAVREYLSRCYEGRGNCTEEMVAECCKKLEDGVVTAARRHMAFFTKQAEGKATIKTHLKDDPSYYGARFRQHKAWNDVREAVDGMFYPYSPLPWSQDDTTATRVHADERITTTAVALCELIDRADWVEGNSVLNTAEASYKVAHEIRNVLFQWAVESHNKAGQPYENVGRAGDGRQSSQRAALFDRKESLFDWIEHLRRRDGRGVVAVSRKRKEPWDSDAANQRLPPPSERLRREEGHDGLEREDRATAVMGVAPTNQRLDQRPPRTSSHARPRQSSAASGPPRRPSSPWLASSPEWSVDGEDGAARTPGSGGLPRKQTNAGRPRSRANMDGELAELEPGAPHHRESATAQRALVTGIHLEEEQSQLTPASSLSPQPTRANLDGPPVRSRAAAARDANTRTALPERRDSHETRQGSRSSGVPSRLRAMAGAKASGRVIRKQ